MEWITITAIIIGPILAVQVQKWIERALSQKISADDKVQFF